MAGSTYPFGFREAWLCRAVAGLGVVFAEAGYGLPPLRVSIGWMPRGRGRYLAECWPRTTTMEVLAFVVAQPVGTAAAMGLAHGATLPRRSARGWCAVGIGLPRKPKGMSHAITTYEAVLANFLAAGFDPAPIREWANVADPIFRRNRRQVVAVFPVVAITLAHFSDTPMHHEMEAIINRGDPLIKALAAILQASKRAVRFLRGKTPTLTGPIWAEHPTDLLRAIAMVCSEKLPRTPREWALFWEFWWCFERQYHTDARYFQRPLGADHVNPVIQHVIAGLCTAGYEASAARVAHLLDGDFSRLAGIGENVEFVSDWCDARIHHGSLGRIDCFPPISRGEFAHSLLLRYAPMEVLRQYERWHREMGRLAAATPAIPCDPGLDEWSSLPGLSLTVGELTVCSLTNGPQLRVEGAAAVAASQATP